ncbi:probable G-protein coupled receptor 142 [Centrocercus urophasianus]|uniref:probable G-protein coupled receptor 142 n=1 Tax=Centrocercus urophasianus TaxID=9002 RepID=UPI001C652463|nr:probable G-protein coupled receptor 142 [Centrocercus urophasianus]
MVPVPNSTAVTWPEPEQSPCMVGIFPVVYYSVLLGLGLPVNVLTAVALSRLATRTKKSSYWYLLALTTSDILTQVFIIFVGFILQTAILARAVPRAFIHIVNVLEFTANHASIWVTVLLTVDRYVALCHPLRYRAVSYPRRTRRIIAAVFAVALATGIPFYWWLDAWRDADPPTALDRVLKWVHCVTIYFLPCSIFLATNSVIIHKLKQRGRSGRRRLHRGKTMALLLAITTVFIVLWAPRTAVMMCHLYVASVKRDWRVHLALDIANMVAMLNTTLNFFLYCFVSETFRRAVSEVLCGHTWHGLRHSGARFVPPAPSPLQLLGTACSAGCCHQPRVSVLTQHPVGSRLRDAAPLCPHPQSCGAGGGGSSQLLSSSNDTANLRPGLGPGELCSPGEEAM